MLPFTAASAPLECSAQSAATEIPFRLLERLPQSSRVSDWLTGDIGRGGSMPVSPKNGVTVVQNPPIFSWPLGGEGAAYEVVIANEEEQILRREVRDNWLFLDEALEPGTYDWKIRLLPPSTHSRWLRSLSGKTGEWSERRKFVVPLKTQPFVFPNVEVVLREIANRKHPRSDPGGPIGDALRTALLSGDRSSGFAKLVEQVRTRSAKPPLQEPPAPATSSTVRKTSRVEALAVREAAFAWRFAREPELLAEALRRALHLAAWDPGGTTGMRPDDHANRTIAFALAYAYDILKTELTQPERARLLASIGRRTQDLFAAYIVDKKRSLKRRPFNSHGFRHIPAIAAIASLMIGELEEAPLWFREAFPLYAVVLNAWMGEDGGVWDGTNYTTWRLLTVFRHNDVLLRTTGIDIMRMAGYRQFGLYLSYFLPAGTPRGLFGDGAEHRRLSTWSRMAVLYKQRAPGRVANAYANSWPSKISDDLEFLYGPLAEEVGSFAEECPKLVDLPSGAAFSSIGWVAMLSDQGDPMRTSVYFRASRFGSHNHAHASQNSFVVYARGEPLLVASGYYDGWGSPHHRRWTQQTVAHNAITFDGGKGQKSRRIDAIGQLRLYRQTPKYDTVTGDAIAAYVGQLDEAVRTLLYLRPNLLLIYDSLKSGQRRRWEWNFHALERMKNESSGVVRVEMGDASVCIELLEGPASRFSQTNEFSVKPRGGRPNQWHGVFRTTSKTEKAEFLVLLSVDCESATVTDVKPTAGGGFELRINGSSAMIGPDGAAVR